MSSLSSQRSPSALLLELPIHQLNGCVYYGPSKQFKSFTPPRGAEIFIARIPHDFLHQDLINICVQAGALYDVRLMRTFSTTNRGYAFARYFSRESAENAIKFINGYRLERYGNYHGHLVATISTDHRTLMLSGCPAEVRKDEVEEFFNRISEGQLESVEEERKENKLPIFYLVFASHRIAAVIRKDNIQQKVPYHWGILTRLCWQPNSLVSLRIQFKKERNNVLKAVKYSMFRDEPALRRLDGQLNSSQEDSGDEQRNQPGQASTLIKLIPSYSLFPGPGNSQGHLLNPVSLPSAMEDNGIPSRAAGSSRWQNQNSVNRGKFVGTLSLSSRNYWQELNGSSSSEASNFASSTPTPSPVFGEMTFMGNLQIPSNNNRQMSDFGLPQVATDTVPAQIQTPGNGDGQSLVMPVSSPTVQREYTLFPEAAPVLSELNQAAAANPSAFGLPGTSKQTQGFGPGSLGLENPLVRAANPSAFGLPGTSKQTQGFGQGSLGLENSVVGGAGDMNQAGSSTSGRPILGRPILGRAEDPKKIRM